MAATITIGTISNGTSGIVYTATLSGGVGTYSPSSGVTGITVTDSVGRTYPQASATISLTTLTVTLSTPAASGTTMRMTIATSPTSNLTDTSSNTPIGQTNVATTNNSTVSATRYNIQTNASVFEVNVAVAYGTWNSLPSISGISSPAAPFASLGPDYMVEFVADCTDVDYEGYCGGPFTASIDGASGSTVTGFAATGFLPIASGLTAGRHLVRISLPASNGIINGVRVRGSGQGMYASPTTKYTIGANTLTTPSTVGQTTPVTSWGTFEGPSTSGFLTCGYQGSFQGFQISGTGCEISTTAGPNAAWAVSVDGGFEGPLVVAGDSSTGVLNSTCWTRIAGALSNASHTIRADWITSQTAAPNRFGVRVTVGGSLASSASSGTTTITLFSSPTGVIAANDWVRIDTYGLRECRQVTGISGNVLTLNSALSQNHAANVDVVSYSAPAGTITSYSADAPTSGKRVVAMGDSNTQQANVDGFTTTPDANGTYYAIYDPRWSYGSFACKTLGHEYINIGTQGTDTINQAGRAADINNYSRSSFDFLLIREGTNDINGNTTTASQCQTNVITQITTASPNLRSGGLIWLLPVATPQSTTSPKGLNLATFNAVLVAIAGNATYSAFTKYAAGFNNGIAYASDIYSASPLHYTNTGIAKNANNTVPLLSATGYTISGPSTGTVGVASASFTVTRAGNSTYSAGGDIGSDMQTVSVANGVITATATSGTISGNGTASVVVTPANGVTSWSFTITPATAGSASPALSNAQGWIDPIAPSYTATSGSGINVLIQNSVRSFDFNFVHA